MTRKQNEGCLWHTPLLPPGFSFLYVASHFGFAPADKEAVTFITEQLNFQVPQTVPPLSDERLGAKIQLPDSIVQTEDLRVKCNLSFRSLQKEVR